MPPLAEGPADTPEVPSVHRSHRQLQSENREVGGWIRDHRSIQVPEDGWVGTGQGTEGYPGTWNPGEEQGLGSRRAGAGRQGQGRSLTAFSLFMTFYSILRKSLRTVLIFIEQVGFLLQPLPEKVEVNQFVVVVEFNQRPVLHSHLQTVLFPLN